jgi:uncharacterized integral membrane protein
VAAPSGFDPAGGVAPAPGAAAVGPVASTGDRALDGKVLDSKGRVRRSRSSALWAALIGGAIVLIALLVFILQNSTQVSVHFLGFHGKVGLGVALLLAAIAGLLLVAIPGSVRILQLQRVVRKTVGPKAKASAKKA